MVYTHTPPTIEVSLIWMRAYIPIAIGALGHDSESKLHCAYYFWGIEPPIFTCTCQGTTITHLGFTFITHLTSVQCIVNPKVSHWSFTIMPVRHLYMCVEHIHLAPLQTSMRLTPILLSLYICEELSPTRGALLSAKASGMITAGLATGVRVITRSFTRTTESLSEGH